MEKTKKRIYWVDILRGLAMFLVVYGHTSKSTEIKQIIYSFHMPLFFIISGMSNIFQKEDLSLKTFLNMFLKSLIIPYFLLNLVLLPVSYYSGNIGAVAKFTIPEFLVGILYSNNLGCYDAPSNATWFITTLFLVEVLFYFLKKIFKNDKELMLGIGLIGLAGYANSVAKWQYDGPWHIQVVLTAVVLYYIGYIFMKNVDKIKTILNTKTKIMLTSMILLGIGLYCSITNTRVSMTADKYGSILYFYMAALAFSFAMTFICMRFFDRDLKIINYIGKNTILWLAIQIPIIRLMQHFFPIFEERERYTLLLAIIVYFAIVPISMLINKLLPFLVGKSYKKREKINRKNNITD